VETPEYESTLIKLAQLMVEIMCDGCAIDLHMGEGGLHRVTVAAKHNGIRLPDAATASNSDQCIVLPLKARGRMLGQLTLVTEQHRAGFDAYDLSFATELAARAALIVDNARLYQEARNASMAKSAFLASMSHELRTPLNAILGYTELMELGVAGPITEGQTQQLERITASAWHLLTVIEEILTFSRVEAGREEVHAEPVPLSAILEEAAAMIQPVADRKALAFVVETTSSDVILRTDRGKLRQILLNLLSNAVKFTESGGVRCLARAHNGGVLFEVHDTGAGIAPEHLERIFEPFWQAAHGSVRKAGGTGLGLTVSRQLAQLLGGDIQVRSTVGQGSTFSVFIPSASTTP
jgi:signal transduction histidine kinase